MKPTKNLFSQNNNQTNANGQSDSQKNQDNTMALVYPDGRVTNVKVGKTKSS